MEHASFPRRDEHRSAERRLLQDHVSGTPEGLPSIRTNDMLGFEQFDRNRKVLVDWKEDLVQRATALAGRMPNAQEFLENLERSFAELDGRYNTIADGNRQIRQKQLYAVLGEYENDLLRSMPVNAPANPHELHQVSQDTWNIELRQGEEGQDIGFMLKEDALSRVLRAGEASLGDLGRDGFRMTREGSRIGIQTTEPFFLFTRGATFDSQEILRRTSGAA